MTIYISLQLTCHIDTPFRSKTKFGLILLVLVLWNVEKPFVAELKHKNFLYLGISKISSEIFIDQNIILPGILQTFS